MMIKSIIKSDKGIKVEEIIHLLTFSHLFSTGTPAFFFLFFFYSPKFYPFFNHFSFPPLFPFSESIAFYFQTFYILLISFIFLYLLSLPSLLFAFMFFLFFTSFFFPLLASTLSFKRILLYQYQNSKYHIFPSTFNS